MFIQPVRGYYVRYHKLFILEVVRRIAIATDLLCLKQLYMWLTDRWYGK